MIVRRHLSQEKDVGHTKLSRQRGVGRMALRRRVWLSVED